MVNNINNDNNSNNTNNTNQNDYENDNGKNVHCTSLLKKILKSRLFVGRSRLGDGQL